MFVAPQPDVYNLHLLVLYTVQAIRVVAHTFELDRNAHCVPRKFYH